MGKNYIRDFLCSLCEQSYRDFRLYVRDDGSSDATNAIVSEYSSILDITILSGDERLGPAKGFFRIMEEAEASRLLHVCRSR